MMPTDRRLRDAALLLPLVGAILFVPAILRMVSGGWWLGGLPSLPVFIAICWLGLIVFSAWLARRLSGPAPDGGKNAGGTVERKGRSGR